MAVEKPVLRFILTAQITMVQNQRRPTSPFRLICISPTMGLRVSLLLDPALSRASIGLTQSREKMVPAETMWSVRKHLRKALHKGILFVRNPQHRFQSQTIGDVVGADEQLVNNQSSDLKCGVWVLDVLSGSVVATVEFQQDIEEVFDVQVLLWARFPALIGLRKGTADKLFVLP